MKANMLSISLDCSSHWFFFFLLVHQIYAKYPYGEKCLGLFSTYGSQVSVLLLSHVLNQSIIWKNYTLQPLSKIITGKIYIFCIIYILYINIHIMYIFFAYLANRCNYFWLIGQLCNLPLHKKLANYVFAVKCLFQRLVPQITCYCNKLYLCSILQKYFYHSNDRSPQY